MACRGSHTLNDIPYFVLDDKLVRIEADGTSTALAGTITGSGPVSMAENGTQLCILDPGGDGFIYTTAGGLVEITDSDFRANGNPTAVTYIDGYFLFTTDTKKIIVCSLNDGTAYSALDFGTAESDPDELVAPVVLFNQLFVGGTTTFEAYSNIGGSGFPFQRSNLFFQQGISARFSLQSTPDTFTWIGRSKKQRPSVWVVEGNQTRRISTRPIDLLLGDLTTAELSAITSWSYGEDGHYFVGWNLPDTTIVYDFATQRWHERQSRINTGPNEYTITASRQRDLILGYGRIYCGDSEDNRVGRLSSEVYDEYGQEMQRQFTTQPFQNNLSPFFVPYLELHLESGVGGTTQPRVTMEQSKDGGHNYISPRRRTFGKQGEYTRRAIWRRLGRTKMTSSYRFTISDPVKVVGIQLVADIVA
jgi:hypothetical protein